MLPHLRYLKTHLVLHLTHLPGQVAMLLVVLPRLPRLSLIRSPTLNRRRSARHPEEADSMAFSLRLVYSRHTMGCLPQRVLTVDHMAMLEPAHTAKGLLDLSRPTRSLPSNRRGLQATFRNPRPHHSRRGLRSRKCQCRRRLNHSLIPQRHRTLQHTCNNHTPRPGQFKSRMNSSKTGICSHPTRIHMLSLSSTHFAAYICKPGSSRVKKGRLTTQSGRMWALTQKPS
jgi:hypothetical protein